MLRVLFFFSRTKKEQVPFADQLLGTFACELEHIWQRIQSALPTDRCCMNKLQKEVVALDTITFNLNNLSYIQRLDVLDDRLMLPNSIKKVLSEYKTHDNPHAVARAIGKSPYYQEILQKIDNCDELLDSKHSSFYF